LSILKVGVQSKKELTPKIFGFDLPTEDLMMLVIAIERLF